MSQEKVLSAEISAIFFLLVCLFVTAGFSEVYGQQTQKVNKELARGNFINDVKIILVQKDSITTATSQQIEDFYNTFFIKPGTTFNPILADLAMRRISAEDNIETATYELFDSESGSGTVSRPLTIIVTVKMLDYAAETVVTKGILTQRGFKDFPMIYESKQAQFKFFMNGAVGLYNDVNALFGEGPAFSQGNPIADDPAIRGTRFWMESSIEPGISGISKLGSSNIYWYGEASAVISGRNTTDIYSSGSTIYFGMERLYGGFLATALGKNKDITINANYGRNYFQLNDGFLFAKTSGSSNAGPRGSVYSSSRTAFQKNGNLAIQYKDFKISGHFVEPQELFRDKQLDVNYIIGTFNYNDNKNLDLGISYISTSGGRAKYSLPDGSIEKKGMYVINPKVWLSNIASTGLFIKSEYAYQAHHTEDMESNAWYLGVGYSFKNLKTTPSVYYRYSFLQGDDGATEKYERFDPILTGVLGNWVQGLNFRKLVGNGNLVSHRVELTSWISPTMAISFDYFNLRADQLTNNGGLAPITTLKNKMLGQEGSLTLKGLLNKNMTLLGIVSYATPGKGLELAFVEPLPDWLTVQAALFLNF